MSEPDRLADQFDRLRPYLISVGYSMLGSVSEAEDAVQEAWLRLRRSDAGAIEDLRAWLTTVVGRICLDMLKARRARREDQAGLWLPEPLLAEPAADGPENQAVIAESIGLALLIVLESLSPPERLAFVLHDVFAVPFDSIGGIMGRTPEAARQLASRARRRVQAAPQPDPDLPVQRRAVDAFLAAARGGDFEGLLELLAPEVVLRFDPGQGPYAPFEITGARAVARHILRTAPRFLPHAIPATVNGSPGALYGTWDEPLCVLGVTVANGKIAEIHLIADRAKLRHMRLTFTP
jgi:RNA polymerase sigma-70 factor (ECF subfamily)